MELEKLEGVSKLSKRIAIIYHYPCYDGSYAALNAYIYYSKIKSPSCHSIEFYPSNYQNRISEVPLREYRKVYILDKGLNDEDYLYIYETLANCNSVEVIIIDHHNSSIELFNKNFEEIFKNLQNIKLLFDNTGDKSASGMSYDYFKNKSDKYIQNNKIEAEKCSIVFSENYKLLNEYVEDSDTGKYSLHNSHEFKSGLSSYLTPLKVLSDFRASPKFLTTFYEVDIKSCMRFGEKSYKKYKKNSKKEISGNKNFIVELVSENTGEKWKFIACFTDNKQYRNHACPILSQISYSKGFAAIGAFIYHCEKDIYKLSMRTHMRDFMNLGYICSIFGGGGHKTAAAFSKNSQFFDSIIVSKIDLFQILQYY